MKIYQVGGCVRDLLIGLNPKDIDYIMVCSNEQELLSL
jgi:tRNA nucleotidyltransferase/poly(A) polymerase